MIHRNSFEGVRFGKKWLVKVRKTCANLNTDVDFVIQRCKALCVDN